MATCHRSLSPSGPQTPSSDRAQGGPGPPGTAKWGERQGNALKILIFGLFNKKKKTKQRSKPPQEKRLGQGCLLPACLFTRHIPLRTENWGVEGGKGGGAASHREKATGSCPRGASDTGNDPGTPPPRPSPGLQLWPPAARTLKKAGAVFPAASSAPPLPHFGGNSWVSP